MEAATDVTNIEDMTIVEDWIKVLTCPRCSSVSESTDKRFKFGVFDGVGYYCSECEKTFNAYYRDNEVSHTIPSGDVEIIEYEDVEEEIPESFDLTDEDVEPEEELTEPQPEEPIVETVNLDEAEPILMEMPDPEEESDESQEIEEPEVVPEVEEPVVIEEPVATPALVFDTSSDDIIEAIRKLKEDVGQLSELSSEENLVVDAFSKAFMEVMSPLAKALPVDVNVLPEELGIVERANIIPQGKLVLLHADGRMASIDLTSSDNRDLLVQVIGNVMPRFNSFIAERRQNVEKRLSFLSNVTKELQSIANAFG